MNVHRRALAPAVILGLGFLSAACGGNAVVTGPEAAGPAASALADGTATPASADGLDVLPKVDPSACRGFGLTEVDRGPGWVAVEAASPNTAPGKDPCGVPEFGVSPAAKLAVEPLVPHRVLVSGKPGWYRLTAWTPYVKPVVLKLAVK